MIAPLSRTAISIRPAREADAAQIASAHIRAWQQAYAGLMDAAFLENLSAKQAERTTQWARRLADPARVLVMVAVDPDDRVVGFASGGPAQTPEDRAKSEIYALYLLSECQGAGVGAALWRALTPVLREVWGAPIVVWVISENPSVGFYRRMGGVFARTGTYEVSGEGHPMESYTWS